MALINCKECGRQVSKTAAFCPGCGAKLPKQIGMLGWFILLAFTVLVVQCTMSGVSNDTQSVAQTPEQRKDAAEQQILSDAKWQCRGFMEKTLKAPATAKFQNYNEFTARQEASGSYLVRGYVDSQNSYGAMIRTSFRCQLKRDAGQWSLMEID